MIYIPFPLKIRNLKKNAQRTNGRTDRPTDRRTDRPSYRDAWTHLKTVFIIMNFFQITYTQFEREINDIGTVLNVSNVKIRSYQNVNYLSTIQYSSLTITDDEVLR